MTSRSSADRAECAKIDSDGAPSLGGDQNSLSANQNDISTPGLSPSLASEQDASAMMDNVPHPGGEVSVLLPSNSTLRLRPRRRARSATVFGPGPIPPPALTGANSTASAPSPASSILSPGSGGFAGQTSSGADNASIATEGLMPRNGRPLIGIRAKYAHGGANGYASPETLAHNILRLASVSTDGPQTLEEIDAISAEAAANTAATAGTQAEPNGTAFRDRARSIRFDDEAARSIIAKFRASPDDSPPSPPKASPRRRLSLPSVGEPNGLHCPGRDELRNRAASDPGLNALCELVLRGLSPAPLEDASSPTDVDRSQAQESEAAGLTVDVDTDQAVLDTEDAVMITPRRRNRLRRSPRIDPVLEVDESRETMPRWALDYDNFINGLEDQEDDDDAVEEDAEDQADSFSELNESVGH